MVPSPSEFREQPRIAVVGNAQLELQAGENPANAIRRAAARERASHFLGLLDRGKTLGQIAEDEGISRRTVKNTVRRERKLRGVESEWRPAVE